MDHEELVASQRLYQGRILNLRVDDVSLPDGRHTIREVVEHRGGVAIAALDDEEHVLLVRQYRHAIGQALVELPAGTLEAGEAPLACAARELEEETGYQAASFELLLSIYPSPGYTTELTHIFLARQLRAGRPRPESDEYIDILRLPLREALDLVYQGKPEICNSLTVIGLLMADLRCRAEA